MQDIAFQFILEELDGVRVIRIVFPPAILLSVMAETYARYMALWESEVPTVVLADISRLERLEQDALEAIGVLLRRVGIMPAFIGSAWVCGDNRTLVEQIGSLMREAGRDARAAVEGEAEGVAFLRGRIARWRDRLADAERTG